MRLAACRTSRRAEQPFAWALAIHLAKNRVDCGDARDDVGDDLAFDDFRKSLQVDVRGRTEMAAQGLRRAIAGDKAAKLSARRFDGDVGFAGRGRKAFGENLEVVDERL